MIEVYKGQTSFTDFFVLVDSSTGLPKSAIAAAAVTAKYVRTRGTQQAITVSDLGSVNSAFAEGGWKEIDSVDQTGLYRIDIPNAAFADAAGVDKMVVSVKATGCKLEHKEYILTNINKQVASLPNIVAGEAGGLPIGDSSGRVLLQPAQAGVTIPTVTNLTNAPSDSSGTTTLLSRLTVQRSDNLDNLDLAISEIPGDGNIGL
jgi:hypothetical protein